MSAEQDVFHGTDTPEWNEARRLFAKWLVESCDECGGSGTRDWNEQEPCPDCGGSGKSGRVGA